ncbi:glycosyltransferase family 71 protein, partial [Piromyces sp. E2]
KGIVICTGDRYFKYVRSTINTLRTILHCTLPIEIVFMGDKDLSAANRQLLSEEFDGIYFNDISNTFRNMIVGIEGYAIKPFALIASRFEEIILMDADVTYLRNPEELFTHKKYQETGTFFFRDRTLNYGGHEGAKWLKTWMVDPLPITKKLRFWKEESIHEMDSSTVVVHKTKALLGLLAACKFNEYHTRLEVVYQKVLGDKETFWMGFDMARQPYYLNRKSSLFVGELNSEDGEKKLCGHVGQQTEDGKVLYWNGHLIKNK